MTAYWNVPYVGQVGIGANEHGNDCGPVFMAIWFDFNRHESDTFVNRQAWWLESMTEPLWEREEA
jgi:hypothetical protein